MPWFKVDDRLYSHPKILDCSMAARGLWLVAGSWCAGNSHDGVLPKGALRMLGGTPRQAAELVASGLWMEHPDGWAFHDWTEYQPSAEQVAARRRSDTARQQVARSPEMRALIRQRDRDRCRYCGDTVRWNDRRGPLGGTYDHVIPDGPTDIGNLVVTCRACNASKGHRTPDQAGMVLRSETDLDHGPRSDLGVPCSPTRPDPTRPLDGPALEGSPPLAATAATPGQDQEGLVDFEHQPKPQLPEDQRAELVAGVRALRPVLAPPPEDAA